MEKWHLASPPRVFKNISPESDNDGHALTIIIEINCGLSLRQIKGNGTTRVQRNKWLPRSQSIRLFRR